MNDGQQGDVTASALTPTARVDGNCVAVIGDGIDSYGVTVIGDRIDGDVVRVRSVGRGLGSFRYTPISWV